MSIQVKRRREAAAFLSTYVGAQGELLVDTTNNRVQIHDGATPGGWPAAKLGEVVTTTRTAVADANYTVLASDRTIAVTALTAARTLTLPAAAAYPTGTRLLVVDESGACSATLTLTLAAAGTDRINGAATATIATAYGYLALESNNAGRWTIVDQSTLSLAQQAANAVAISGGTINGITALGIGTSTPAQPLDVLGTMQTRGTYGSTVQHGLIEDLIACSGASATSTRQIPSRAVVLAVSVYVVSAITGASSFSVDATTNSGGGAGGSGGQFGASLGTAAGSSNVGVIGPTAWYAPSTIKLTAAGGSFTGGTVRIAIQYLLCTPPTM